VAHEIVRLTCYLPVQLRPMLSDTVLACIIDFLIDSGLPHGEMERVVSIARAVFQAA